MSNKLWYVYILQAGEGGPIKIGRSCNLEHRLENLQGGNFLELSFVAKLPCPGGRESAAELESFLHHKCKEFKIRNEWFRRKALKLLKKFNSTIDSGT